MKKPVKKHPVKKPVKKKPVRKANGDVHTSMPGWTDQSEAFKDGAIVQAMRRGSNAYLDIRLPADRPKGSVSFYVQGTVEEAIAWLIKNKDRLKYAAQAG